MSTGSKKSITRNASRPARRARRGAPAETTMAETMTAETTPATETTETAEPAIAAPADAPSPAQVAQLAFRFFADSGFVHGHALDHWLQAETELNRGS